MDQGEHLFRFRIHAGPVRERMESIDLESRLLNSGPMSLCCYPAKRGKNPGQAILIAGKAVKLGALKMNENGESLIIRIFETTGNTCQTDLTIPGLDICFSVTLNGFEIKTIAINLASREIVYTDLMERCLDGSV